MPGVCVCAFVCVRAFTPARVGLLAALPSLLERHSRPGGRVWPQQPTWRCPGEGQDLQANSGWLVEESSWKGLQNEK